MLTTLVERFAWAISTIKEDRDLGMGVSDVELAKTLGTNKDTLSTYRKGGGLLKSEVIENLIKHYEFNPQWLFKGEGEPFPGAKSKYPEVCGSNCLVYKREVVTPSMMHDTTSTYTPSDASGFNLGDDLALAAKVLTSHTHYATALHLNIRSFAAGIQDISVVSQVSDLQKRLAEMELTIKKLQDDNKQLQDKYDILQAENKDLRKEVNRLKATYESPEGGTGSLTDIGS